MKNKIGFTVPEKCGVSPLRIVQLLKNGYYSSETDFSRILPADVNFIKPKHNLVQATKKVKLHKRFFMIFFRVDCQKNNHT